MAELLLANQIAHPMTGNQVGQLRDDYLTLLDQRPFPKIPSDPYPRILAVLKRENCEIGPYVSITPFEAANRIASDLTLIEGVQQLFAQGHISRNAKVQLRLGTMHTKGKGDFSVFDGKKEEQGEAFDVNPTFFRSKLYKTLKKWHKNRAFKYVVFNSDCLKDAGCKTYFLGMKQKYPQVLFLEVRSWHQ
jgi:hypothetical protein